MTDSTGGSPFASCTGRAVCVRPGHAAIGQPDMFRGAGPARATILIASPGCWSSAGLPVAEITACGFRVVLSSGLDQTAHNDLISTGIFPVCLNQEAIAKVQDAVGSDPGIVLTVDAGSGEVRARGEILARFEIDGERPRPAEPANVSGSRSGDGETLAGRLLLAQRLLRSARLSGDDRIRLQRRLVAICDAVKAPGADAARSARRLDRLLSELARISPADPPGAPGRQARAQALLGAGEARG